MISAWVSPTHGNDATALTGYRDKPFKTLQHAIDTVQLKIIANGHLGYPEKWATGIVYALPGLYGRHLTPSGAVHPGTSGDVLPILMRDRVHVQGLGARRCVLRGTGDDNSSAYRPCPIALERFVSAEVLVSFAWAGPYTADVNGQQVPWLCDAEDVVEVLDGFTFQGGDIQVAFHNVGNVSPLAGRVSNCLFDMRHGIPTELSDLAATCVQGASIGVYASPRFVAPNTGKGGTGPGGYLEIKAHVLNNTFVLDGAIKPASAIVDVCNTAGDPDPSQELKGISQVSIQNNLIYTGAVPSWSPANGPPDHAATIGLADSDALVSGGAGSLLTTNAFGPLRARSNVQAQPATAQGTGACAVVSWGSSCSDALFDFVSTAYPRVLTGLEGFQCSGGGSYVQFPLYDRGAPASLPPSPAVQIWNGITPPPGPEKNPAFVSDMLVTAGASLPAGHKDYRIMPGSPLMEMGHIWTSNNFLNGAIFTESACPDVKFLDWDGEGYGNPRKVGQVDIGFDEAGIYLMAGSYANHENSHNLEPRTAGGGKILNAAAGVGQAKRYVVFAYQVPGASPATDLLNSTHSLFAVELQPASAAQWGSGWTNPPLTHPSPIQNTSAEPRFDLEWISFDPADQTPTVANWVAIPPFTQQTTIPFTSTTGQSPVSFLFTPYQLDNEPTNFGSWFNTQFMIVQQNAPQKTFLTNVQVEYR